MSKLAEKGVKLQQALVLVQFLRQCDEVMFWINDKVKNKFELNKKKKCLIYLLINSDIMFRKLLLLLMSLVPI